MTVNILGTDYEINIKKYDEDDTFERLNVCGYCTAFDKKIVICDLSSCEGWKRESQEAIKAAQAETMRHEIIHAFLNESGLKDSCLATSGSWAKNEEMIDWIAIQSPKLMKAFKEAKCL